MTNKEIKLELAKVALERCSNFTTIGTLTEALRNLYDWVVEEPEVEVETNQENQFDSIDIKEVVSIVRKSRGCTNIATMLNSIFSENNINTVGDLTRVGRLEFSHYRHVGLVTVSQIDNALEKLGVTTW